jgi:hypothetical protein
LIIRLLHREAHVMPRQVDDREADVVDPAGEVAIQNLGDAVPGDQGHGVLELGSVVTAVDELEDALARPVGLVDTVDPIQRQDGIMCIGGLFTPPEGLVLEMTWMMQ